jgi:hypothetical protein
MVATSEETRERRTDDLTVPYFYESRKAETDETKNEMNRFIITMTIEP